MGRSVVMLSYLTAAEATVLANVLPASESVKNGPSPLCRPFVGLDRVLAVSSC